MKRILEEFEIKRNERKDEGRKRKRRAEEGLRKRSDQTKRKRGRLGREEDTRLLFEHDRISMVRGVARGSRCRVAGL